MAPRPPRHLPLATALMQARRVHYVANETELRQAVDLVVASNTPADSGSVGDIGHEIVIVETFAVTSPVILPRGSAGTTIRAIGNVALTAGASIASFFSLRDSLLSIVDVSIHSSDYEADTFVDFASISFNDRCRIIGCSSRAKQFATGAAEVRHSLISNNRHTRSSGSAAAINLNLDDSIVQGCVGTDFDIVVTGGGSNAIVGNTLEGGAITTTGSSGSNILAVNTNPGAKTLHASDIDDDVEGGVLSLSASLPVVVSASTGVVTVSAPTAVVGPSSATDNAVARYDGTTGKLVQGSLVEINDSGDINIPADRYLRGGGEALFGYTDAVGSGSRQAYFGSADNTLKIDFVIAAGGGGGTVRVWVEASTGYVGINPPAGVPSPVRELDVNGVIHSRKDVVVDDSNKGLVLKSPNGHYWRQTIDNAGAITWTDLGTTEP